MNEYWKNGILANLMRNNAEQTQNVTIDSIDKVSKYVVKIEGLDKNKCGINFKQF